MSELSAREAKAKSVDDHETEITASNSRTSHESEVTGGTRFAFGENWARYLSVLDESRVLSAQSNLKEMLGVQDLDGKTFLDIGSGSGIMSLAARRMGATVVSFDFDPESVACTREVKSRYLPDDKEWTIEEGSVLDVDYLKALGKFDVVLSWGVLHHTGAMWRAIENAQRSVEQGGKLFIAIYNDQGRQSQIWWWVKKSYVSSSKLGRSLILLPAYLRLWGPTMARDLLKLQPFKTWRDYGKNRGMSAHYDVLDWVGGFPFEVATPEAVTEFHERAGFALLNLKSCGKGLGCNEFVFERL